MRLGFSVPTLWSLPLPVCLSSPLPDPSNMGIDEGSAVRRPSRRLVPSTPDLHYRLHRYRGLLPRHIIHGELVCLLRPPSHLGLVGCFDHTVSHQHDR